MSAEDDLRFAHRLADVADEITMGRFRALDLRVDTKPDLTPASEADTAAEAAVRALVHAERPGEGVVGEEAGGENAGTFWLVDPIDGTKNYVRGMQVWGTLLAVQRDGVVECALASAPALGKRWWAIRNGGAFADGKRCRVSEISRLEDAYVSLIPGRAPPPGLAELSARAWSLQALGGFWQHVLVAEGIVDVATQPNPRLWDLAAPTLIVEEAGGRATTFEGAPPADETPYVTTNGLLHGEVVRLLSRT